MKRIVGIALIFGTLIFGCDTSEKTDDKEVEKEQSETQPLEVLENGVYTEWYPGRKQIKVRGRKTKEGEKDGVWRSYNSEGYEMSIVVYKNGEKHGHVIVYHPNGAVYYSGEYEYGERVGEWKFYNEKGALVKEENYDSSTEE